MQPMQAPRKQSVWCTGILCLRLRRCASRFSSSGLGTDEIRAYVWYTKLKGPKVLYAFPGIPIPGPHQTRPELSKKCFSRDRG